MNKELISGLQNLFDLKAVSDIDQLSMLLFKKINHLIVNDFDKLIQILYRIDVSEAKLKNMLIENATEDAAKIITQLIIERQKEKIESRNRYRGNTDFSEAEKWES
ncbi:MAG: hypothetical protein ABIO05_04240 [Ferruginibacter sp.]